MISTPVKKRSRPTSLTGDTNINEGETANYSALAEDPNNDELTYIWDFGDNSDPATGTEVNHIFRDNGNYTVTLTVIDAEGSATAQTFDVTVDNLAPTITKVNGETTVTEGEEVNLSAITFTIKNNLTFKTIATFVGTFSSENHLSYQLR